MVTLPGAPSHFRLLQYLGEILHKRGADVTILTERVDGQSLESQDGFRYILFDPVLNASEWRQGARAMRFSKSIASMMGGFRNWAKQTDVLQGNKTLMSELQSLRPNLIVGDMHFVATYALSNTLAVPRIYFSCAPLGDPFHSRLLGLENNLNVVPQLGSRVAPPRQCLWPLIKNVGTWIQNQLFFAQVNRSIFSPVLEAHGISSSGLYDDKALTLINTHPAFDWNRPLPPHVHYVGPLLNQNEPTRVFDASEPFLLISFGTFASLSEKELIQISGALSRLQSTKVIWKLSADDLPSTLTLTRFREMIPSHVQVKSWIDQQGLLQDPMCKGFITQGGINSLLEVAAAGKPVAVLPLIGDQDDNCEKAVAAGFGVRVTTPVTADGFHSAIKRLLFDDVLTLRARQLSQKIASAPRKPVEAACDLVEEFVAANAI